jgi:hypothetical protein
MTSANAVAIPFEIDHLFICTEVGAPAAEALRQAGLSEGSGNVHPGQGTANRRYFFHNLMLELLWVDKAAEAQAAVTRPTHLWERWQGRSQTCPFGVCLRPASGVAAQGPPFSSWAYRPAYLPPTLAIAIATNAAVLREPLLFYLPFAQRQDRYAGAQAQPLAHGTGWREVTRIGMTLPQPEPRSQELAALCSTRLIDIQTGPTYLMELGFDGESQGQHHDLRSDLPLILHW